MNQQIFDKSALFKKNVANNKLVKQYATKTPHLDESKLGIVSAIDVFQKQSTALNFLIV